MITKVKALIIVHGSRRKELLPVLGNHEALVQISDSSEIQKIWALNKTPIIQSDDILKVCNSYKGALYVFNTDEQGITSETSQPEVTEKITAFCYALQIEPGEWKVPNVANNSSNGCLFCENIIGKAKETGTFVYNLGCKFVDMIIYESQNFIVVPGLGPLAPGYLMIMSKEHYLSLAQMPESMYQEYSEVEEDMQNILNSMYGKPVAFYEHGTGPNGAVGLKSLVHMHIHLMLDAYLPMSYREMIQMSPIQSIKEVEPYSYFTYKYGDTQLWCTTNPEVYIQRQFHRQVYAEKLQLAKDQFNWRKTSFDERTTTNVWQLFVFLSNATLSPRISERTSDFVKAAAERF